MKAVILAGGIGTRLKEETYRIPKPMLEIGNRPILWHIMKIFSANGINDFIICLGYKGYLIKEYFANYSLYMSDITFNFKNNSRKVHQNFSEPWTVTLVDTGLNTEVGGRIKKILPYVKDDKSFCLTYGDGLGDINIRNVISFHNKNKKLATVTAVRPPARFGAIGIKGNLVSSFKEKPIGDGGWINGGFFVLSPRVGDYIKGDSTVWEKEPIRNLAAEENLSVYQHNSFWHPMDTLNDKNILEKLWQNNKAPWKIW